MANSLSIVTNTGAMRSNRSVMKSARAVHQAVDRMSSGLRVRSASDDAAALSTAENMRAQRKGIQQAIRNANDGVSILNTTEATYQSVSDTLVRMRELSVQAASDGLTDTERGYLDEEFQALALEIDRMASVAQYNDIQLADGSSGIDAVNDILKTAEIPVIFITAFPERLLTGDRPEPAFLVTKPFNPEMVKALISQALFFGSSCPLG